MNANRTKLLVAAVLTAMLGTSACIYGPGYGYDNGGYGYYDPGYYSGYYGAPYYPDVVYHSGSRHGWSDDHHWTGDHQRSADHWTGQRQQQTSSYRGTTQRGSTVRGSAGASTTRSPSRSSTMMRAR
ncbi:MAG TPA: hypothetical protein VGK20_03590 [Candidatus Binatia bacterium]|jgi:hypothetical protein